MRLLFAGLVVLAAAACSCQRASSADAGDGDDAGARDSGRYWGEPRCIEDWPDGGPGELLESLDAGAPRIRWSVKLPSKPFRPDLAITNNRVAVVTANKLWLLDHSGRVVAELQDAGAMSGVAPIADQEGNIYFATASVRSIDADGKVKWSVPLGRTGDGAESTGTSQLLLSPEGILVLAATDGLLYAVHAREGRIIWKKPIDLTANPYEVPSLGGGVGDTFFVGGIPFRVEDGTTARPFQREGVALGGYLPTFDGIVAGRFVKGDGTYLSRSSFFDRCGNLLWSMPDEGSWYAFMTDHEGNLLVSNLDSKLSRYSTKGEVLAGPRPIRGVPLVLGADGVVYTVKCDLADSYNSALNIAAFDQAFNELWAMDLGPPCSLGVPALGEDGTLYLARSYIQETEVLAIQTGSPGLARSAWPRFRGDNGRTTWLRAR